MTRSAALRFVAMIAASTLAGCGPPPYIQVETAIRGDGSCDRSIWQPKDRLLPDGALTPEWLGRWGTVADVSIPPAFQDAGSGDRPYFHARGVFASPEAIPEHFRQGIEGGPELGAGAMKRSYERVDFGLFVEHRWSETLTNDVTREGFNQARDALVDAALPVLAEGFDRVYGGAFDVSAGVEELKKRGGPLLRDLADAWYAMSEVEDAEKAADVFGRKVAEAVERAGVGLRDPKGELVAWEEAQRRVQEHLASRIAATFRHKDGSAPRPEEIDAILSSNTDPNYSAAWSQFGQDRKAEFDAKFVPFLVKMTGYYAYPPIMAPPTTEFAFAVRLPGEIVAEQTNGAVAGGRVSWRFNGRRLFPAGFTMTARSIEMKQDAQQRLLGRANAVDFKAAKAVRDLVGDDPDLAGLLRSAADRGDPGLLNPLPDTPRARAEKLGELRRLLVVEP